jgi:hypothetical protein
MRVSVQDLLHHRGGIGTDGRGPLNHARRRPIQVGPVRGGTMLGVGHGGVRLAGSHMRGDALSLRCRRIRVSSA